MLVLRVIAPVLETNCYVVAAKPGTRKSKQPALVIDPGAGACRSLAPLLVKHRLVVHAVALTHGHADHIWDAWEVSEAGAEGALGKGAMYPVYLGPPDHYRLEDPAGDLGPGLGEMFTELAAPHGFGRWIAPATTGFPSATLQGGGAEIVPGLSMRAVPAPGHTEGSTVLLVSGELDPASHALLPPGAGEDGLTPVLAFTGDVLFAGSIGRTDLPGGDEKEMTSTLRTLTHSLPPHTAVLPGHGPASTLAAERERNPHLRRALG